MLVPFSFFSLCKHIRSCLGGAVKHSGLLRVVFRYILQVTVRVMQCEAVIRMPELSVGWLVP